MAKQERLLIDPSYYYKDYVKIQVLAETEHEIYTRCPFHKDEKRSFSISKKPGKEGLCHCQGACNRGWNVLQFHMQYFKVSEYQATLDLALVTNKVKLIQLDGIKKQTAVLLRNDALLKYLHEKRGYTDETITQYQLGYDGERLWIPITYKGKVLDVRKHDWQGKFPGFKSISIGQGYGKVKL